MKKAIVTTTINPPTVALKKFIKIARNEDWHLFIVGDLKTDHRPYRDIEAALDCVTYLDPEQQEAISQELSDLIGWNCIQRRNFGLIAAYKWGADIIATVDDDNIPYDNWGKHCKVNREIDMSTYKTDLPVFDPLSPIFPALWHRGFPIQMLYKRQLLAPTMTRRLCLIQADFWDGAPDVDAVARIALNPIVKFEPVMIPLGSNKLSPFNSQNTFLSRAIFPTYFLFPHVGRMDDIWAAYVTQFSFPDSVVYCKASVYQERNPHDLTKDLEAELLGYKHNAEFVVSKNDWKKFLPDAAIKAYDVYTKILTS